MRFYAAYRSEQELKDAAGHPEVAWVMPQGAAAAAPRHPAGPVAWLDNEVKPTRQTEPQTLV